MNTRFPTTLEAIDRLLEDDGRVLVASDFDGTLCPIAETPARAALAPAMGALLEELAASEAVTLAIVSGRELYDLAARVPVGAVLAANHGLEISGGGCAFEHPQAREYRPNLSDAFATLQGLVESWHGAWIEDKRLSLTVHYRNVNPRAHHTLLFAVRRALSRFGRVLAMRCGDLALEVRPRIAWTKGSAVAWIREQTGPYDACICLGNSTADESMFIQDSRQVNIRVGCIGQSAARFQASGPMDVAVILGRVLQGIGRRPVSAGARVSAAAGQLTSIS